MVDSRGTPWNNYFVTQQSSGIEQSIQNRIEKMLVICGKSLWISPVLKQLWAHTPEPNGRQQKDTALAPGLACGCQVGHKDLVLHTPGA